jgi:SAM-dependent methyltransferase
VLKNKERYAIGLAIERHEGEALYVHRNPESAEYRGFWSLPTMTIDKTEYDAAIHSERHSIELLERLVNLNLGGIHFEDAKFLVSGSRQRAHYLLHMAVFSAMSSMLPDKRIEKYDDFQFLTPSEFLKKNNHRCGTSVSLYFQNLVKRGDLPSTIYYLEVPPELADSLRPLEDDSPEELWRLAAPNYSLLQRGKTGEDGYLIRALTLDRFLREFVDKQIREETRVLEVGSGDGAALKNILERTKHAYGLELVKDLPVKPAVAKHIFRGNLYNIPVTLRNMLFDWVVLNLLLYWLPDLEKACSCISSLLSERGKVLVTVTPPEFTKNGQWERQGSNFTWVMTEPLRRGRSLAMINRTVGPLWFYPRSTIDIIQTFGANGLFCTGGREIYIDSYLSPEEHKSVLSWQYSLCDEALTIPVLRITIIPNCIDRIGNTPLAGLDKLDVIGLDFKSRTAYLCEVTP